MRVFSRIALTLLASLIFLVPMAAAQSLAGCPLRLVNTAAPPISATFGLSPHGAFRYGTQFLILRGEQLTAYTITDLGTLQVSAGPQDYFLPDYSEAAREPNGGIAFNSSNGLLFLSSEAGLEVFDLTGVKAGGAGPQFVSFTPGLHYRRLAVNGNVLAGTFPATDYPCYVGGPTPNCVNTVDIFDVSNPASPNMVAQLQSQNTSIGGFNDVAFNYGFLVVTGQGGTADYNVSNPAVPTLISFDGTPGTFLVSNGTNLLGIGNPAAILTTAIVPPGNSNAGAIMELFLHTIASVGVEHSNPIIFHPQATYDEAGGRLITMIDELDPLTLQSARTFAFDVFDFAVPMFQGKDPRQYEQVSYTQTDEVKFNPLSVGANVYVVGEVSGLQQYGDCGQMDGRIEWTSTNALVCGGAQIHGWVTGATRIQNVTLMMDGGSLGKADMTGPLRTDVPSTFPVQPWRVTVNLDSTTKGLHMLTAIGTDVIGNTRQFASQPVLFGGPGQNCQTRRRTSTK